MHNWEPAPYYGYKWIVHDPAPWAGGSRFAAHDCQSPSFSLSNGSLVSAAVMAKLSALLTRDRLFGESTAQTLKVHNGFCVVRVTLPQLRQPLPAGIPCGLADGANYPVGRTDHRVARAITIARSIRYAGAVVPAGIAQLVRAKLHAFIKI